MLKQLCDQLSALKTTIDLQGVSRANVQYGEEYTALGKQISELMEKQNSLLAPLPDSRQEYDDLRKEVIEIMKKEQIYAVGDVTGKWKEKNEVNRERVMTVIGGDVDLYFTLSNISQVRIKEYAKENPELKKELLGCIETVSRELVDLDISPPQ